MEDAKIDPIIISLRRQDIAEMAALTSETTIRAIRKLAAKNLIKIERGKIIIGDAERLRAYLADQTASAGTPLT
jgi:CRP-like cAMP-binding protein